MVDVSRGSEPTPVRLGEGSEIPPGFEYVASCFGGGAGGVEGDVVITRGCDCAPDLPCDPTRCTCCRNADGLPAYDANGRLKRAVCEPAGSEAERDDIGFGVGVIRAAQDASVDISSFVFVAVGLLLMIMGNFLGKVRKNFFLGIRTPWTLASDEVWAKTHRLGGWCFVIAGAFMAIMGVAAPPSGMPWVIAVIVAIALVPVVYSYIAYRRIEGFAPDPDIEE